MNERVRIPAKKPVAKRENRALQTRKTDLSRSINSPVVRILFLQRIIGNRAVQRLIKSGTLQTKLRIGRPNDIYEQEADRVAERVMRMPEPSSAISNQPSDVRKEDESVQRKPTCAKGSCEEEEIIQPKSLRITPLVQRKVEEEEEEEILQTKETSGHTPEVTPDLESRIRALKGGGQPLPESVRAFFEPRFGYDFSQVQMHNSAQATEITKAVNARAFTVGRDIVFGPGQYAPETMQGQRLLAHELTHVVQSRGKDDRIGFWPPEAHESITREVGLAVGLPGDFVFHIEAPSTLMDFRATALTYNVNVLIRNVAEPESEAPNHGEGGLYRSTNESATASINITRQSQYLQRAIALQRDFAALQKRRVPVHELGSKASEIYGQLGHALHVAQDRGSHGEGLCGRGHGQKRFECDNISENHAGYEAAKRNSREVLMSFKVDRGY